MATIFALITIIILATGNFRSRPGCESAIISSTVFQDITINTSQGIHTVDRKFLSVAIDSHLIRNKWRDFNISNPRLTTLTRGLYPAYLRVGGTDEDFMIFQENPKNSRNSWNADENKDRGENYCDFGEMKKTTNFIVTEADLEEIHKLSVLSGFEVYFGLNVRMRTTAGTWNSSNPEKIMKYTADRGYGFSWELGNEPRDLKKFGTPMEAKELGNSFLALRRILDNSPELGSNLVGPDVTGVGNKFTKEYLLEFLTIAADTLKAVTWHQYYLDGHNCTVSDFYDPEVLDMLLRQLQEVNGILSAKAPDKRGWLGETASAYGGGAAGISDRYVAGFMWLDKLGLAAVLRHDVVMRQTLFGGRYALVNKNLRPNPDYWLSLLHKRLVGKQVLQVEGGLEELRMVRVYAHCTNVEQSGYQPGAVTIMVLNLHRSTHASLRMTGCLEGMNADQYLLTPDDGGLTSKFIRLNGKLLELLDDETLPSLNPLRVAHDNIQVPPLTFGFFVLPMANAPACSETLDVFL